MPALLWETAWFWNWLKLMAEENNNEAGETPNKGQQLEGGAGSRAEDGLTGRLAPSRSGVVIPPGHRVAEEGARGAVAGQQLAILEDLGRSQVRQGGAREGEDDQGSSDGRARQGVHGFRSSGAGAGRVQASERRFGKSEWRSGLSPYDDCSLRGGHSQGPCRSAGGLRAPWSST